MSGRHRLGVALLLDPPVADEVEGLRRGLGDISLGRVAPHLTLVSPVNVRAQALGEALAVLRHAAARVPGPLQLELGPVATFMPASPVIYLGAHGEDLAALGRLREAVSAGPLSRPGRWQWVPHVTLADEAPPERISAAMEALGNYSAVVEADRAVLLEERERHWWPLADACFGAPAIVGRGGLDLVMVEGRLLGPDVLALFDAEQAGPEGGLVPDRLCGTVLTGLRDDRVVGAASAWRERATGATHAGVLVEAGSRNQGVGRALLMAVEAAMARLGWAPERVIGHGPAAFFTACSALVRAPG